MFKKLNFFKENRFIFENPGEVPGGVPSEGSKSQEFYNFGGDRAKLSGDVLGGPDDDFSIFSGQAEFFAALNEMDSITDVKYEAVERLCQQKADYGSIMEMIRSKGVDEVENENRLLAAIRLNPKMKNVYDQRKEKMESMYKKLLADNGYDVSSFSLVDVEAEDAEKPEGSKADPKSLANQLESSEYERNKVFEVLGRMGVPQGEIDRVFNDWTNPYVDWAIDTLGKFNANQIKKEKQSKDTTGVFDSTNLNRLFNWEKKVYPELLKIVGGEGKYSEYDYAIRKAVLEGAPRMGAFLDLNFDNRISNPVFYVGMNSLVKAELDEIMRGETVKQPIKQDEKNKKNQRKEVSNETEEISDDSSSFEQDEFWDAVYQDPYADFGVDEDSDSNSDVEPVIIGSGEQNGGSLNVGKATSSGVAESSADGEKSADSTDSTNSKEVETPKEMDPDLEDLMKDYGEDIENEKEKGEAEEFIDLLNELGEMWDGWINEVHDMCKSGVSPKDIGYFILSIDSREAEIYERLASEFLSNPSFNKIFNVYMRSIEGRIWYMLDTYNYDPDEVFSSQ